jgi:hypothetical protein
MAATSVLSPELPVARSWRLGRFAAISVALALAAIVAFFVVRIEQDRGTTTTVPATVTAANATPAAIQSPTAEAVQLNALLDTPEGRAAVVHEFAPGYFGGHPASSQSTASSPAAPNDSCPVVRGPC